MVVMIRSKLVRIIVYIHRSINFCDQTGSCCFPIVRKLSLSMEFFKMKKFGEEIFLWTIFFFLYRIIDSVIIRENMGQRKTAFWHISRCVKFWYKISNALIWYFWYLRWTIWSTFLDFQNSGLFYKGYFGFLGRLLIWYFCLSRRFTQVVITLARSSP